MNDSTIKSAADGDAGDSPRARSTPARSPIRSTGAIMTPIYATSTYVQTSPACTRATITRASHNPTRIALERCVADLEGGARGIRVRLRPGGDRDGARAARRRRARRRQRRSVRRHLPAVRAGAQALAPAMRFSFVDLTDPERLHAALDAGHQHGLGRDADQSDAASWSTCAAIAKICRERGISRRRRQHLRQSVGAAAARARLRHRRALGDQVSERPLGRDRRHRGRRRRRAAPAALRERLGFLQNAVGAIAGPFDSFLVLRGLKTLALRMERHCANALALAQLARASSRRSRACTTRACHRIRSTRWRGGRCTASAA